MTDQSSNEEIRLDTSCLRLSNFSWTGVMRASISLLLSFRSYASTVIVCFCCNFSTISFSFCNKYSTFVKTADGFTAEALLGTVLTASCRASVSTFRSLEVPFQTASADFRAALQAAMSPVRATSFREASRRSSAPPRIVNSFCNLWSTSVTSSRWICARYAELVFDKVKSKWE